MSMSMQSLKKIGQKLHKLESGNEALMDGRRTDRHTDGGTLKIFGGYNIIPRHKISKHILCVNALSKLQIIAKF